MTTKLSAILLGTAICALGEHGPVVNQIIAKYHQTPVVVEGKPYKLNAYEIVKQIRADRQRLLDDASAYHAATPPPGTDELNNMRIKFEDLYTLPDDAVVELYAADVLWAMSDSCAGIQHADKHGKVLKSKIALRDYMYAPPSYVTGPRALLSPVFVIEPRNILTSNLNVRWGDLKDRIVLETSPRVDAENARLEQQATMQAAANR